MIGKEGHFQVITRTKCNWGESKYLEIRTQIVFFFDLGVKDTKR